MKLLSADSFNKDNNVYVFGLKFLFFTSKCNIFLISKIPILQMSWIFNCNIYTLVKLWGKVLLSQGQLQEQIAVHVP